MNRNYNCKKYDTCLDQAAFANKKIDCNGCLKNEPVKIIYDYGDLLGCSALLLSIFGMQVIHEDIKPKFRRTS